MVTTKIETRRPTENAETRLACSVAFSDHGGPGWESDSAIAVDEEPCVSAFSKLAVGDRVMPTNSVGGNPS